MPSVVNVKGATSSNHCDYCANTISIGSAMVEVNAEDEDELAMLILHRDCFDQMMARLVQFWAEESIEKVGSTGIPNVGMSERFSH